jgi:hypothetical protein
MDGGSMSRASIRFWEWVAGLVLIGLGCLFLREMGVKIPPEIISFLGGIKDAIVRLVGSI